MGDDYASLDRVYLPEDWMDAEGAKREDLGEKALTPALRRVADRCLEATRALNREAAALAGGLKSRRLGMESAVIHRIALKLTDQLSRRDPLAERVKLNRWELLTCGLGGVLQRLGR